MKTIKLSNRLACIAELAGKSDTAADVGTDHAFIPVWLIQNGMAKHVIASDVKNGPLERAMSCASEYGVEKQIDFVLSDGVAHLNETSADTVIIAGMGGETIAEILKKAAWVKGSKVSLVLQPMSKTSELVKYLYDSGLHIENAKLSEDCGEIYLTLLVKSGRKDTPSSAGLLVPEILFKNGDSLLKSYLVFNIKRIKYAIEGMKASNVIRYDTRLNEYENLFKELDNLIGGL